MATKDDQMEPDKSRVVLRSQLECEIRKLWADIVKELCEKAFLDFASPCRCSGNDPLSLVGDEIREFLGEQSQEEWVGDNDLFGVDPFETGVTGESE